VYAGSDFPVAAHGVHNAIVVARAILNTGGKTFYAVRLISAMHILSLDGHLGYFRLRSTDGEPSSLVKKYITSISDRFRSLIDNVTINEAVEKANRLGKAHHAGSAINKALYQLELRLAWKFGIWSHTQYQEGSPPSTIRSAVGGFPVPRGKERRITRVFLS
jgi:hypothetical protein